MDLEEFMENTQKESKDRIKKLHYLAKRIWKRYKSTPIDLQNRCLDAWDNMKDELDCNIIPLIPVHEDSPITNLIFGSGSFSTGEFQAQQYRQVKKYTTKVPVLLQGIVANKSEEHKCNAAKVCKEYKVPLIELDFIDWYHEFIDKNEPNPIRASRYWFSKNDPNKPSQDEILTRFKIRQNHYHKNLGEKISFTTTFPTAIVSARGYNFQFCKNIFHHQNNLPHINDTHPSDLTYIDPITKVKLYAGWQSGAVKLMIDDNHETLRGCLIEVNYMDKISQINELDEGVLLSLGKGVTLEDSLTLSAQEIQSALKLIDDYFFCTLEPTGLILMWGITDKKLPVTFKGLHGEEITIHQKAVIVGDKLHSGINAWGSDFENDIKELEEFLFLL